MACRRGDPKARFPAALSSPSCSESRRVWGPSFGWAAPQDSCPQLGSSPAFVLGALESVPGGHGLRELLSAASWRSREALHGWSKPARPLRRWVTSLGEWVTSYISPLDSTESSSPSCKSGLSLCWGCSRVGVEPCSVSPQGLPHLVAASPACSRLASPGRNLHEMKSGVKGAVKGIFFCYRPNVPYFQTRNQTDPAIPSFPST